MSPIAPHEAASAEPSDEALVKALAVDRAALGPLYDRHGGLVYGLARAVLQSSDEAEDLTQEVFMNLCQQSASFDPARGSLAALLATMTRSRAIDRLRNRNRRLRLLRSEWQSAPPPDPALPPVERVAVRESAERVRGALADLPADQRRALEMVYYQGLTQAEIAVTLDAPLGTVKSWCRRGLLSLRATLADLVET